MFSACFHLRDILILCLIFRIHVIVKVIILDSIVFFRAIERDLILLNSSEQYEATLTLCRFASWQGNECLSMCIVIINSLNVTKLSVSQCVCMLCVKCLE